MHSSAVEDGLCAIAYHLPPDFAEESAASASPESQLATQLMTAGCADTLLRAAMAEWQPLDQQDRGLPVPGCEGISIYNAERLAQRTGPLYMDRLRHCQALFMAFG